MDNKTVKIDVERLRDDLEDDCMGAYYGGGFGGALAECSDIDRASPEQVIRYAQQHGIDVRNYIIR